MGPSDRIIPHYVLNVNILGDFPPENEIAIFGMGCFWGAERLFWNLNGVYVTAVGYAGGGIKNPTYKEVCSGTTNHSEVVLINYNPRQIKFETLLEVFLENHDPTQGNRQGNDIGSQYRSCIYTTIESQMDIVSCKLDQFQKSLYENGFGKITTEIKDGLQFYYAEEYHQQYLAKNPNGYCGIKGTGVYC
ncbi:MAG: peptide-methionine (S)-S-oxide reductase MsrA [Candidatus Thermoplasmatota archaeon]|nr:peptide-methionine (S)-S-oxide reductase MsrA [Candidatus Thermoplasmatota archaeon]